MHDSFMIVLSTLFVVVFAIMMHSMFKHRRNCDHSTAKLTGANGTVQWLWALVPFAILAFVDIALINAPIDRSAYAAKKVNLTIAQNLTSTVPAQANDARRMRGTDGDRDKSASTSDQQALR